TGDLGHRVAAVSSHFNTAEPGPWTGELGVAFKPFYHSVSALQKYNRLPYEYFLERVLGVSDQTESDDSPEAMEQGSLVHSALESSTIGKFDSDGLVDVSAVRADLGTAVCGGVSERFRSHFDGVLAMPVWNGDAARWAYELDLWWADFLNRMDNGPVEDPREMPAFKAALEGSVLVWVANNDYPSFESWHRDLSAACRRITSAAATGTGGAGIRRSLSGLEGKLDLLIPVANWLKFMASPDDPRWRDDNVQEESFGNTKMSSRKAIKAHFNPRPDLKSDPIEGWIKKLHKDVLDILGRVRTVVAQLEPSYLAVPGSYLAGVEFKLGSKTQPLPLKLSDDITIMMSGSIDRLEFDRTRKRLAVCDYKTGRPVSSGELLGKIRSGEHLQLPLYAVAVDQMVDESLPHLNGFRVGAIRLEAMKRKPDGDRPVCAVRPDGIDDETGMKIVDIAKARAAQAVAAIESGRFPVELRGSVHKKRSRSMEAARIVGKGCPPALEGCGALENSADGSGADEVVE
ncbi:MAG TPA: PD-(D/E)XK nuclease family protein, partial [Myxococcota bacterium]|nr:PD-(D/E)XK nuclease family protein [Myxococcota bacterium]